MFNSCCCYSEAVLAVPSNLCALKGELCPCAVFNSCCCYIEAVLAVPSTLCGHCISRKGSGILVLCLRAAAVTVKLCQLFLALFVHRKGSSILGNSCCCYSEAASAVPSTLCGLKGEQYPCDCVGMFL